MKTRYLLDTHAVLWWLTDPDQLSQASRAIVADSAERVLVSAASAWEMAIKQSLGRLDLPGNLATVIERERFEALPVTIIHALAVADLPRIHTDPFDRLLIAQAQIERCTIITRDRIVRNYDVPVVIA